MNIKLFEQFSDEKYKVGDLFYVRDPKNYDVYELIEISEEPVLHWGISRSEKKTDIYYNVSSDGNTLSYTKNYFDSIFGLIDNKTTEKYKKKELLKFNISQDLKNILYDFDFKPEKPNLYEYTNFDTNEKNNNLIDCKDANGKKLSIRTGKFFKMICPNSKPTRIEYLVGEYKSRHDMIYNKINLEIVKGEEIRHWYLDENYKEGHGSLNNSCMRFKDCQKKLNLYCDNPKKVALVILKSEENKLLGRALLWKLDKPNNKIYMDRIYTVVDFYENIFLKFARKNGYLNYYDSREKMVVELKTKSSPDKNPYMDTFSCYNYKKHFLTNYIDYDFDEDDDNYETFDYA